MQRLYIANKNYSSWSLRPWVLMKELGIDFEEKLIPFTAAETYSDFRHFSPTGKVPCLTDNDITVWDSLAIIEYLAEQNTNVWPSDDKARAWARCATAEMHSGFAAIREVCGMNIGLRVELKEQSDDLKSDVSRIEELWLDGLSTFSGPFLAGDSFTAVDAFYAPIVFRFMTYDIELSCTAQTYCDLILSLNSMKEWQQRGIEETWRDQPHEMDILKYGTVLSDLRTD